LYLTDSLWPQRKLLAREVESSGGEETLMSHQSRVSPRFEGGYRSSADGFHSGSEPQIVRVEGL